MTRCVRTISRIPKAAIVHPRRSLPWVPADRGDELREPESLLGSSAANDNDVCNRRGILLTANAALPLHCGLFIKGNKSLLASHTTDDRYQRLSRRRPRFCRRGRPFAGPKSVLGASCVQISRTIGHIQAEFEAVENIH